MIVGRKIDGLIRALVAGATLLTACEAAAHSGRHAHFHGASRSRSLHAATSGARVLQCVAFAKQDAGIEIAGNARDWWANAAGFYERGSRPESGSVLSFRASYRMPLGHVAVVASVEDSRTIVIDQSHWNSSGITRDIEVKDVSEDNDWTSVRVQLGHGTDFGSIYATHGFIYPRPDRDAIAAVRFDARQTRDLQTPRVSKTRHRVNVETEIAEAGSRPPLDLTIPGIALDAPSRGIR